MSWQDLTGLARLLGIPHFLTEVSVTEAREDLVSLRKAKKMDDNGKAASLVQLEAVKRIQKHFLGFILRRSTTSLDWEQKKLLNIPDHKDIRGILTLTERETKILQERAEDAKAK